MKKINIAIAGSTGTTGRKVIEILEEREISIDNIYALASSKSSGKKISFNDSEITVSNIDHFDFSKVDVVFSCMPSSLTKKYSDKMISGGAILIDKSSYYRMREDVPLIVPEVNEDKIIDLPKSKIISSPNCVAIPLSLTLSPLINAAKIKRVILSTYQSVSGAGKEGMDELYNQTKTSFMPNLMSESKKFERQIAFNLIPKIDDFDDNGDTFEETKIIEETQKILNQKIPISVTSVRVPIFIGHSMSVNIEFESEMDANLVEEILQESEGINLISTKGDSKYLTPKEIQGDDMVYVSRVRLDKSRPNSINLWICSDNTRKGAATNAVQILESIRNKFY